MSRIDDALRRAHRDEPVMYGESTIAVAEPPQAQTVTLDGYTPEKVSRLDPARVPATNPPNAVSASPKTPRFDEKLAFAGTIPPVSIEQYRRLGAVLEQAQAENGLKSVLVSSAIPREGKTLTAANVALTLSEAFRRRVLLIDADLRRPRIHTLFGIGNDSGLAELLIDPCRRFSSRAVTPNLSILTAGRAGDSPIAGLSSTRMHAVMSEAVNQFDWVLVDTPPLGLLTDAQLVARVTNGVLLVIAAGLTPYALVQRAIDEVGPDRIVGTVLNRVAPEALPSGDYYGRYYGEPEQHAD